MDKPSNTVEIDRKELAELIDRIEEAIEHNLSLSVDDLKLLLLAISTLCTIQDKMEQNDVTLQKLRKLLGMVRQSEQRRNQATDADKKKAFEKTKK